MSAIFKEKIVPKLEMSSLEASEVKAILQVLELMNITDTDVYQNTKNNYNTEGVKADFTEKVAQLIYFHPAVFANEKEGLTLIASWVPLLEK